MPREENCQAWNSCSQSRGKVGIRGGIRLSFPPTPCIHAPNALSSPASFHFLNTQCLLMMWLLSEHHGFLSKYFLRGLAQIPPSPGSLS